jgi:hypothetical protein
MATHLSVRPIHVRWHVMPLSTPRALRRCAHCDRVTSFASSDKFRVNAHQRRLDVWLIYKCTRCSDTWNRPLFERATVQTIGLDRLARLQRNDADAARAFAVDLDGLRRSGVNVDDDGEVRVEVEPVVPVADPPCRVEVAAPLPCAFRLDRLVAQVLGISRSAADRWYATGLVRVEHGGKDAWRRPLRDGTRLLLRLSMR